MVSWAGPFVEHMCLHPIYDWIPISEASSILSTWIRYSEYFNELFTWLLALILTSASCARLKKCGLSKNRYPMVFQNLMNHQVSLLHGHNWGYGNKKKGVNLNAHSYRQIFYDMFLFSLLYIHLNFSWNPDFCWYFMPYAQTQKSDDWTIYRKPL